MLSVTILFCFLGLSASYKPFLIRPNSASSYMFQIIHSEENSWLNAREKCLAHRSDLVSINSLEELDWIMQHLQVSHTEHFAFVGLMGANNWQTWLDGSNFTYSPLQWAFGNPTSQHHCGIMNIRKRELLSVDCDLSYMDTYSTRFICERTKAKLARGPRRYNATEIRLDQSLYGYPTLKARENEEKIRETNLSRSTKPSNRAKRLVWN